MGCSDSLRDRCDELAYDLDQSRSYADRLHDALTDVLAVLADFSVVSLLPVEVDRAILRSSITAAATVLGESR